MGLFEQAHGGTLFLDEVGEISATIQTKLLRVLQEKEVRRIGDNKVISVNVRIISATNKSIGKLADQGLFRRDLMYRLDVLRLFLPPLRQRENDAELLFGHLLAENQSHYMGEKQPVLSGGALTALHGYPFSGNIRELKNIVERAAVTCSDGVITREDILKALYPPDLGDMEVPEGLKTEEKKEEAERFLCKEEQEDCDAIKNALKACRGNQSRAAKLLGINRTTLWRKLQKYGIRP